MSGLCIVQMIYLCAEVTLVDKWVGVLMDLIRFIDCMV